MTLDKRHGGIGRRTLLPVTSETWATEAEYLDSERWRTMRLAALAYVRGQCAFDIIERIEEVSQAEDRGTLESQRQLWRKNLENRKPCPNEATHVYRLTDRRRGNEETGDLLACCHECYLRDPSYERRWRAAIECAEETAERLSETHLE